MCHGQQESSKVSAVSEKIYEDEAKEWLADHPERRDPLLQDLTALLFEVAAKPANDRKTKVPA